MLKLPPLSLYIHVPWCVKKCPYCDFNSHRQTGELPEAAYVDALLSDFRRERLAVHGRPLHSVFIGGGTPSLMSAAAYQKLFTGLREMVAFKEDIEITLEVNPGTWEHDRFQAYLEAGINRLSLGVQSFQDSKLQALGRIHSADEAHKAIASLSDLGFRNFNIDLMHGLPDQSNADAIYDLKQAIALKPAHISWYQLTIEPNTVFYSKTPALPPDDTLWAIQEEGQSLLAVEGYEQYEISAYSQSGQRSRHNLNYWQFGDYIGIGAGAHGKLTLLPGEGDAASSPTGQIIRNWKTRMPADYLAADSIMSTLPEKRFEAGRRVLEANEMPIEFMMNVLRLNGGAACRVFSERTGQPLSVMEGPLNLAVQKRLLENPISGPEGWFKPTPRGRLFLNDLLELFA